MCRSASSKQNNTKYFSNNEDLRSLCSRSSPLLRHIAMFYTGRQEINNA